MTMAGVPEPAVLRARWTWYFAVGAVFTVLGVIALGNLVATTLVTTLFIGVLLLVGGVAQIVGAIVSGGSLGGRLLGLLLGVLYVLVGYDILGDPLKGAITITIVVALFLFAGGLVRIVGAFTGAGGGHRVLLFATGVINVILGFWLWTGIPVSGLAIGLFVGIDMVMAGVTWMFMAWTVRQLPEGAAGA